MQENVPEETVLDGKDVIHADGWYVDPRVDSVTIIFYKVVPELGLDEGGQHTIKKSRTVVVAKITIPLTSLKKLGETIHAIISEYESKVGYIPTTRKWSPK
ncbi:MAG: hypothetical protein ACTSX9_00170 [Candidatus Njordarchaeales archaeon]